MDFHTCLSKYLNILAKSNHQFYSLFIKCYISKHLQNVLLHQSNSKMQFIYYCKPLLYNNIYIYKE